MKDETGKVIYVGKSVNLKSRVSSYFQESPHPNPLPQERGFQNQRQRLTPAKYKMIQQVRDIETILCQTEVEALVLETNLIKHLTPKYNILMKDDKNLAYIKITNSPVPEVYKTRQKTRDGAKYFGPFTSGANIHESVKNLKRIFRIRNCRMQFQPHPLAPSPSEKRKQKFETIFGTPSPLGESRGEVYISDKAGKTAPCMDYYI